MSEKKVLIIGAGLAGLGAAWDLSERGIRPIIVERSPFIGGMAGSIERNGYIFDFGIHGLFTSAKGNESIVERLRSLLGDELFPVEKKTSIYFNGHYLHYPLRFRDMFMALTWHQMITCFVDFAYTRVRRRLGYTMNEESFEGWIKSHFGAALYALYFGPYAEKVWGVPCNRLSSAQLLRRVTTVSLWDIFKKAARRLVGLAAERKGEYSQQPQIFYYGVKGARVIGDTIGKIIEKNGGTFLLEHAVQRIHVGPEGRVASVTMRDATGREEVLEFDYLISSASLPWLVRSFDPPLESEIVRASEELRYRAILFVNIMLARPRIYDAQWVYYSHGKTLFNRVNEYPNLGSKHFAPEGKTSLSVEVTCFEGDHIWNLSPEELFERCARDLKSLGLIRDEEIEGYFVERLPYAYPLFEIDTERHLAAVLNRVAALKNVHTVGRLGRFIYMNMDEVLLDGIEASRIVWTALRGTQ